MKNKFFLMVVLGCFISLDVSAQLEGSVGLVPQKPAEPTKIATPSVNQNVDTVVADKTFEKKSKEQKKEDDFNQKAVLKEKMAQIPALKNPRNVKYMYAQMQEINRVSEENQEAELKKIPVTDAKAYQQREAELKRQTLVSFKPLDLSPDELNKRINENPQEMAYLLSEQMSYPMDMTKDDQAKVVERLKNQFKAQTGFSPQEYLDAYQQQLSADMQKPIAGQSLLTPDTLLENEVNEEPSQKK